MTVMCSSEFVFSFLTWYLCHDSHVLFCVQHINFSTTKGRWGWGGYHWLICNCLKYFIWLYGVILKLQEIQTSPVSFVLNCVKLSCCLLKKKFCSCLPGKLPQPSAAVAGPQGRTCQWGCQATGAEASGLDISWPGRWRPLQGHCQELQRKYSEFLCAVPYVCPKVMPRKYNEVLFCIICFAVRSACPWLIWGYQGKIHGSVCRKL